MSSRASGQILELHRNIYSIARCERVYTTGETEVVLRSSDPSATHAWYVFFFSLPPPLATPRSRSVALHEGAKRADEDAGGGNAEKFITARAVAVADLILRSAARTSRPWCSLVYALGYLWRRSGGRMALWSTDVLRPPKFDAGPPSIGNLKREQNLLSPAK